MGDEKGRLGAEPAGDGHTAHASPNPAATEMISHLVDSGVETTLDRLGDQQPQCAHGLRGLCCSMCQWGPCRITTKSPRGVCGRSMEMVVCANLLRAVAAGTSAQTMHAHEMVLTLLGVSRDQIALPLKGPTRLQEVAHVLNVGWSWTPPMDIAEQVAEVMLDDLGRMTDQRMRALGFAPRERRKVWEALDVLPRSAAFEIAESLHMTTLGGCGDWEALFRQVLRTSLAYAYSGLVAASALSDIMYGIPKPQTTQVNYGVLKPDHVNILAHGHSPVMIEKVLEKIRTPEIQALAREKGASGIVVAGMCCTGLESVARHGIPAVGGVLGQELVLGTGAVDAVVVDMQCIVPGMRSLAECFGTRIVTTCRSNRIPGAVHVPFDPEHPETFDDDAMRIARTAVEAFGDRDRSKMHIPDHTSEATVGFTREALMHSFGGAKKILKLMRDGHIRGVVGMVGCSTPKIPNETGHVTIARELIRNGVLVLTSGCSAHALLAAGLCSSDALADAPSGLRTALEEAGLPPVLAVGGCSDNARIIQVFAMLAHEAETAIPVMPFVLSGPEFAHEKPMGQTLAVLAHGITAVIGPTPALPIPAGRSGAVGAGAGSASAGNSIADFFEGDEGLRSLVGSRLLVRPEPASAAETILDEIGRKREGLGWEPARG